MKKKILYLSFITFLFALLTANVFASTNTDTRTEDDLKIRDSITVTSAVKKAALATPKVDSSEKVYDFAELLTEDEEQKLYDMITTYIDTYDMDMAVVTINTNNKSSSMAYADDFYDYNDFGKGSTYDGVLFLIDMDNRNMWISTTGEAIRMYDDARIDKILDDTYYYISSKDYYNCARAFVSKASSYAAAGIPSSNRNTHIDANGNYVVEEATVSIPVRVFGTLIFGAICSGIFVAIKCSKHKTIRRATEARQYLVNDSFKLNVNEDNFVNTYTSKVYDPPSSSSSGGGGGSSTHTSSSGSSHGGGGRSF